MLSTFFGKFADDRGTLRCAEFESMPFEHKRLWVVDEVPAGAVRGDHGHKNGGQLLVALREYVRVRVHSEGDTTIHWQVFCQCSECALIFGGVYRSVSRYFALRCLQARL